MELVDKVTKWIYTSIKYIIIIFYPLTPLRSFKQPSNPYICTAQKGSKSISHSYTATVGIYSSISYPPIQSIHSYSL